MALRLSGEDGLLETNLLSLARDPISHAAQRLVCQACVGSGAHARMLAKIGIISREDLDSLLTALHAVYQLGRTNSFELPSNCADVYEAVHQRLMQTCGAAAAQLNSCRHHNDESALGTRLFIREEIVHILGIVNELLDEVSKKYDDFQHVLLVGDAHRSFDSSGATSTITVGMWIHAIYEALYEVARDGLIALEALDAQPLGSGEGFGTTVKVDRAYVAEVLRFSRVQRSFMDVNNTRGRYELRALRWISDIASVLTSFVADCLMLQVKAPEPLTLAFENTSETLTPIQQSLLMPLELLRERAERVHAAQFEVEALLAKPPSRSSYDLDFATEPLLHATENIAAMLTIVLLTLRRLEVGTESIPQASCDASFAIQETDRGMKRAVSDGEELKFAVTEWNSRIAAAVKKALAQ